MIRRADFERLLYASTCANHALKMLEAVSTAQRAAACDNRLDALPLSPELGDDPVANCRNLAEWLSATAGKFPTALERQHFFRRHFGSSLQKRWFP